MIGIALQVQAIAQLSQHFGLAGAGHAAQQHQVTFGDRLLDGAEQEGTHGLVAATDPGVFDPRFVLEPLLDDLRTQATAKAIQHTVRMALGELGPGLDALRLDFTGHQLMAQDNGGLLPLLFVAGTDAFPFEVGHQRQIDHAGECALEKFDRRASVHHRPVVEEDIAVIGDVLGHQDTSTA